MKHCLDVVVKSNFLSSITSFVLYLTITFQIQVMEEFVQPAGKDAAGLPSEMVQNLSKDVVNPLAHDIAENARPQTEEFIEKVLKPAVADLTATMQAQAEEIAQKVSCIALPYPLSNAVEKMRELCTW
jgi:hypothetical protein